jgi:hypothetical protein
MTVQLIGPIARATGVPPFLVLARSLRPWSSCFVAVIFALGTKCDAGRPASTAAAAYFSKTVALMVAWWSDDATRTMFHCSWRPEGGKLDYDATQAIFQKLGHFLRDREIVKS